ncbi:MAG: DNA mismatch repair protein MutS [Desulfobacterales bacterium]|nr:DNA mismatch repair protein MutS [Desulfobacterales bacterium]
MVLKKMTPMMQQYQEIKKKHTDSILFFRMGDFYEMFNEDAKIASQILEIALTARNKNQPDPVPMCGIPVKAIDNYISKLIDSGKKVAVCEQVEDPSEAKGIVRREVVRVVTPGMVLDEKILDNRSNNFVLSIFKNKFGASLSYIDISTGTFRVTESEDIDSIIDEAKRVAAKELIVPEKYHGDNFYQLIVDHYKELSITYYDNNEFNNKKGRKQLSDQFNTRSLEGFGCDDYKTGLGAAGAILSYISDTQLRKIEHITLIEPYVLNDFLLIDDTSCRNLELISSFSGSKKGTLLDVIDKTVTSMGSRLLKKWLRYPLFNIDRINKRLSAVDEALNSVIPRKNIRVQLKNIYDLERIISKISMGQANARDFISLKTSLNQIPEIFDNLNELKSEKFRKDIDLKKLFELSEKIDSSIREDAQPLITEGGIIKKGYNSDLDELIEISSDGKKYIAELESREKENTGINSLKVKYNKVFGYFIEVSKANSSLVPESYIRKQTLVNAERYITDELKEYESKVLNAHDRRSSLEYEIFKEIRDEIHSHHKLISELSSYLSLIDCILSLSEVADLFDYCKPELNSNGVIDIINGRHPVIEQLIEGERYVPNSIKIDNNQNQILIITGPNMAGKSTVLRKVAIITLLAHIGSFVPAEYALISLTDKIFTRVGALDNLSQGQSTFMVEMEETANIMNNTTSQSLIIMDEIGRGTSTFDGLSIAWAVAEYLHDLNGEGVKTLFATHYHELTNLAEIKDRVKNFNIAVKEIDDTIIFLRKLVEGGTNKSYGIQVAKLAGIPDSIVNTAKIFLSDIETKQNNIDIIDESAKPPKQLNLFEDSHDEVITKLKKIKINSITPVEALNILNDLQNDL